MPDFVIKRKPKKEYEQFTCRIESALLDEIRDIVAEYNLPSVNEFINESLRFAIENLTIMEETDEWIQQKWFWGYLPTLKDGKKEIY